MNVPDWIDRTLYPFTPRRIAMPEGTLSVVDEGAGPALVFVHGTPSWSFEWRHLVRALADRHRCVAPDLLGFGLSDKPASFSHHLAAHAVLLDRLLERMGVLDAVFLVHDLGGPIGLGAALARLEQVRGLVVFNTWIGAPSRQHRAVSRVVASTAGRLLYQGLNVSPRVLVPRSWARRPASIVREHYLRPFPSWSSRRAPWRMGVELGASAAFTTELWHRRAALAAKPALIVWGMDDFAFGAAELARVRAAFPSAGVLELDGVGHSPQEEAPDEVLSVLEPFLKATRSLPRPPAEEPGPRAAAP